MPPVPERNLTVATTRNGFTVLAAGDSRLGSFELAGRPFVVADFALPAFRWWATFLHAVEPATEAGWEGGHAYRKVAGTDVWSEHAAGTAVDWNASQHPRGASKYAGWNSDQVRFLRWGLATPLGKMIEWGADWTSPDPMHFELTSKALWDATAGWWKP